MGRRWVCEDPHLLELADSAFTRHEQDWHLRAASSRDHLAEVVLVLRRVHVDGGPSDPETRRRLAGDNRREVVARRAVCSSRPPSPRDLRLARPLHGESAQLVPSEIREGLDVERGAVQASRARRSIWLVWR